MAAGSRKTNARMADCVRLRRNVCAALKVNVEKGKICGVKGKQ